MHCLDLSFRLNLNFYKTLAHYDFYMGYYERPKVNLDRYSFTTLFTKGISSLLRIHSASLWIVLQVNNTYLYLCTLYTTLRFDIIGSSYGQTDSIRNSHMECSSGNGNIIDMIFNMCIYKNKCNFPQFTCPVFLKLWKLMLFESSYLVLPFLWSKKEILEIVNGESV